MGCYILDVTIIAFMYCQLALGITNQCAFYHLLIRFRLIDLSECSRFNGYGLSIIAPTGWID